MKSRQFIYFLQAFQIFNSTIWGLTLHWTEELQWEALLNCITAQRWRNWNSNVCEVSNLLIPSKVDSYYVLFAWKQGTTEISNKTRRLILTRAFSWGPIDDVSVIGVGGMGNPALLSERGGGQVQFEQAYSAELLFPWQTTLFYIRLHTLICPSFSLKFSMHFPMPFSLKFIRVP